MKYNIKLHVFYVLLIVYSEFNITRTEFDACEVYIFFLLANENCNTLCLRKVGDSLVINISLYGVY